MSGIRKKDGSFYPSTLRCICVCNKPIYKRSKSDLCFWCKRYFLDSINKKLVLTVTIIK